MEAATSQASGSSSGSATVADLAKRAASRYADRTAIRHRRDGEWQELSYAEVGEVVDEIALGLVAIGVEAGDRVCLLANTRPEWSYASLAIASAGAVVVPIYPTNSPQECRWVAENSEARVVICEDRGQAEKIEQVRGNLPALEHVILIDADGDDTGGETGEAGEAAGETITLADLRARGRGGDAGEISRRMEAVTPDDAYTIIYTSGTTGPPKGCVLTHRNGASVCAMVHEIDFVTDEDVSYLYLPLAHVFALTVQLASFDIGGSIVFFGGDTKQIIAELQEAQPTYLPSVPRIFEKLYSLATGQLTKASGEEREQFERGIEVGRRVRDLRRRGEHVPEELERAFEQADERLFSKVRGLFGGAINQAVTGAAPIAPEILEFFYACGVPVLEGWGMTETTGIGTVSTRENFKFGTVGRALPGVELRIDSDGEILLRGPNVFREYWRNPEATRETFADGWLRTGDLGELDEEGYLSITGRKKDIIITAGGKNLAPANLENDLKQSRWISQAVMYGDRRPYPVALITLDEEEIVPWAREHDLPEDIESLADRDEVRELIQVELDRVNSNYAQVEQIKKFTILDHELSQETGELTPTLKVKRQAVNEKYADLFEGMY